MGSFLIILYSNSISQLAWFLIAWHQTGVQKRVKTVAGYIEWKGPTTITAFRDEKNISRCFSVQSLYDIQ